jgi:hypothetical protein
MPNSLTSRREEFRNKAIALAPAIRSHDNSCDSLLMRTETSHMKPNEPSRTALMVTDNELLIRCRSHKPHLPRLVPIQQGTIR